VAASGSRAKPAPQEPRCARAFMTGWCMTAPELMPGKPATREVDEEEELNRASRAKPAQPRLNSLPFSFGERGIEADSAQALPQREECESDADDENGRSNTDDS
jgi:hypothetical protein